MAARTVRVPGMTGGRRPPLSKTALNRNGDLLRDWWAGRDSRDIATPELSAAYRTVWRYRASYREPLRRVNTGLRSMVARESAGGLVSQRLKRLPMIINKLARFHGMSLARMQDIGGCRAILPGGRDEAVAVWHRIRQRWEVVAQRDYTAAPAASGYRAIHVVVRRMDRLIEIQLRTPTQHEWAVAVERLARRNPLLYFIKEGVAPPEVLDYMWLIADAMAREEAGENPTTQMLAALERARIRAAPLMHRVDEMEDD